MMRLSCLSADVCFSDLRSRRVDVRYGAVGQLLNLGFLALALVLADLALLLVGLQAVHAVAADIADGDAGALRIFAGELGQFLAAFLRQVGDRPAQRLAGDNGVVAQARRTERRSEELRVGEEGVRHCESRWWPNT